MKSYPSLPALDDPPDGLLAGGHLWLQEFVAGRQLRFRMADSGLLAFGDRETVFDPGHVPVPFGHAVRSVRDRFDRDALRGAADGDPDRFVFFAQATVDVGVPYDRPRTPAVLGFDVWDRDREAFLPPDTTARAFDRLGIHPVNAFRKELPVRDFQPDRYAVPGSGWYDGPAAGVVVRNTGGGTAVRDHPTVSTGERATETPPTAASEAALVDGAVTTDRLERALRALATGSTGDGSQDDLAPLPALTEVDVEELGDRVFELVVHEAYRRLGGTERADWEGVQRAVGAAVRESVRDRSG